jgi:fatty acid CoA ligase FadD9
MSTGTASRPVYPERVLELARTDTQLRRLVPDAAVSAALTEPGQPLARVVQTALNAYADRPAFGERAYDVVVDPESGRRRRELLPRFDAISYFELHSRVKGLAGAWRNHDVHRVGPGEFVCILGFSGTDYATVELACIYTEAVSLPLQSSLAGMDLDGILIDTTPVAVAATMDDLGLAAELAGRHPSIRSVIAFDYDPRIDDDRERFEAARTELAQVRSAAQLVSLDELIAFGDFLPWEPLPGSGHDERMCLLVHSSGSTGTPKGAIIVERLAKIQFAPGPLLVPVVRLVFAPMNHFMGRASVFTALARGGTAYFTAHSDMSTLFEDFQLVRPTEAAMFPRVMEMVHRRFLSEVARRSSAEGVDMADVRAEVMAQMRTYLGDRIALISTGSAPSTPAVRQFMLDCFPVTMIENYGSTETPAGVTRNGLVNRPTVIEYRLRDVPELGYYTTDHPYPRGELLVKTTSMIPGYFKRPEATAALFDADGFLMTGDVMEERGPDHLVYIDRRNDVMKLSQGEFVAVGNVGAAVENGSELIHQIFLYGNSARAFLLAVVVPNMELVAGVLGSDPDAEQLKGLLRAELQKVAETENLRSFEIPRDFIVEREPFSHENGLLSSLHKRMRPNLARRYGERLEQMYADIERKQNEDLAGLRDLTSDLSTLERIGKALEAVLGVQDVDLSTPHNFAELGGDSLAAAELSALLEDVFGVPVPVNGILSPAGNLARWAGAIDAEREDDGAQARPTVAGIHGANARQLRASDLDIGNFLSRQVLDNAPMGEPSAQSRIVLVTGATGFLGRFLCLEWMARLAPISGMVFCLVRATDHGAATHRLADAFSGDPALQRRFTELAEASLEVVVGDVGEPRLGLSDEQFDRLAREVDRIVHPAALVNHMLDYEDMFEPNVVGTAELIGLALTNRQKTFDFISSLAAASLVDRSVGNDEDTPLRQHVTLSGDYSTGYGASKWAAELLLHSAHRRFGLPVNVYRGDMMLPHRRYQGQLNAPDIFVRLLSSLIVTGLAPQSFYDPVSAASHARPHYDGLPVDFIAAALTDMSPEQHRDVRTYHVINHHDDGISLDTFVDWINAAGYRVERIPDHQDWLQRFESRLNTLPPAARQRSSLAVLDSLRKPYKFGEPVADSKRFQDAVRHHAAEATVPHLSRDYIVKCLADMARMGLIPAPKQAEVTD